MERLILFALVYLLPTQLAYHFWPDFSYIYGIRVDYLSPAIYLTDLIFIFLLPYLFRRVSKKGLTEKTKRNYLMFLAAFVFIALNILFSVSPITASFKWLTVFKLITIGYYFYSCKLPDFKKIISNALICSLITISIIGLIQFLTQRTIGGIFYYFGERSFDFLTPGISLMNVFGNKLMRAYSVFSHPNSFVGFVAVATLIVFALYASGKGGMRLNPKILKTLLLINFSVFFITLSLNAVFTTAVVLFTFYLINKKPKLIFKTKILIPTLLITASLFLGFGSTFISKHVVLRESYQERLSLANKSIQSFSVSPVLGIGLNNFFTFSKSTQPPHNIYLIIFSECGVFGVLILYYLMSTLFNKKINKYLFLSLIFVFVSGLFDHYWFTLQQNQLLLTMLLGLSFRKYNG